MDRSQIFMFGDQDIGAEEACVTSQSDSGSPDESEFGNQENVEVSTQTFISGITQTKDSSKMPHQTDPPLASGSLLMMTKQCTTILVWRHTQSL